MQVRLLLSTNRGSEGVRPTSPRPIASHYHSRPRGVTMATMETDCCHRMTHVSWTRFIALMWVTAALCLLTACGGERETTTLRERAASGPSQTTTLDTTNYGDAIRAKNPSSPSFDNESWGGLRWSNDLYEGAEVDLVGQVNGGPDHADGSWVKWEMFVQTSPDFPIGDWIICESNRVDDTACTGHDAWVRIRGVVSRWASSQDAMAHTRSARVVYVETLERSAPPSSAATTNPVPTTTAVQAGDPFRCLDCGYEWLETYEQADEDWYEYGQSEYSEDYAGDEVPDWWYQEWTPYCPECGSDNVQILD